MACLCTFPDRYTNTRQREDSCNSYRYKTKCVIVDVFSQFSCLGYFATTTITTYVKSNGRYAMFEYSLLFVACSSYLFPLKHVCKK